MSFTQNKYPDDYISTVFDNYESFQLVDGKSIHMYIDDIPYQEEYEKYQESKFGDADVFLVCFSIRSRASLSNADEKVWIIIIGIFFIFLNFLKISIFQ